MFTTKRTQISAAQSTSIVQMGISQCMTLGFLFLLLTSVVKRTMRQHRGGGGCFLGFTLASANGTGAPQCTAALLPSKCISLQPSDKVAHQAHDRNLCLFQLRARQSTFRDEARLARICRTERLYRTSLEQNPCETFQTPSRLKEFSVFGRGRLKREGKKWISSRAEKV